MSVNLTPNFTLHELVASQIAERHGIDNAAPWWVIENLRELCIAVLQPVRDHFRSPVVVASGYRGQLLERVLKKMPPEWMSHGQHPLGQAADFEVPGFSNADVARWIAGNLKFDQLILEFHTPTDPWSGWVHCSYVRPNRAETLTAVREGLPLRGVVYNRGLPLLPETP